jgi:predicted dehydrogenase
LPGLRLTTAELVAVSDLDADRGRQRAADAQCAFYADYRTMLAETQPDVAVIVTPHPFHAPVAIDCFEAGCHVLVEKPMAAQLAEADAMIEAAARAGRRLAVVLQHRYRPEVRAAYDLIKDGRLGQIQHVSMDVTCPRPTYYYNAAPWRGTWHGEGGGVLLNQAPHYLDLLGHLLGRPQRVLAWNRTTMHRIETEDTVQAILEWPDGCLGSLHISTAVAGSPERIEIVGTGGRLQLGQDEFVFQQFDQDLREYFQESTDMYNQPPMKQVQVELKSGQGDHTSVYRGFHHAVLSGTPPMADGTEGRLSLELANAMIYSNYYKQEVELPLDSQRYAALLASLRSRSGGERVGSD